MNFHSKNNNVCRGFLVLEAIIALALFLLSVFSTVALSWDARRMFDEAGERSVLLDSVSSITMNTATFDAQSAHAAYGNDAMIATFASSSDSWSLLEADTFSAYGKDTCPPVLSFSNLVSPATSVALPISAANAITGLVVKDGFAYVSTDSNVSSDPDLFIFDMSDSANPRLMSSLNTGPGLAGLSVAGPYVFAADDSSAEQLQIIDIHDRSHPALLAQAKVPLDIASSTAPDASAVFYDKGFAYLGTEKGDSPELTVWSVADPAHPQLAGRYEIGSKVEAIAVDGARAYVASSGADQLMAFDVSDPTHPALISVSTPSGWQTQSGQALDVFENDVALGRDTGGFNNTSNPEFVLYDGSGFAQKSSFDEPGGVYALIARPPHFLVLTRRTTSQFRSDDASGTTSAAYTIPGIPAALSCDWGNVYVASNDDPSITLIKDFHE